MLTGGRRRIKWSQKVTDWRSEKNMTSAKNEKQKDVVQNLNSRNQMKSRNKSDLISHHKRRRTIARL